MNHAGLGTTGVRVSRLALGTMAFGTDTDEPTAAQIWRDAREAGINHIDTANVYGNGRSEEICGRLMAQERDQLVVASKAYFPTGPGPNDRGSSRYHLVRAVEASLKRLNTDRLDIYYLHRFDELTALDETLRAMDDLVRAGKVLYPACSNFAAWQVAQAQGVNALHGYAKLVAIQPMYNLVKRQAEVELLPMAAGLGLAVVSYSPTAGGLLSGKYGATLRPQTGRLVENQMYMTRYQDPAMYHTADQFTALAQAHGWHPAALAHAWVLARPEITSVLVGPRTPAQLAAALDAAARELTSELRTAISSLWPAPPPATDRNEEQTAHNYGQR